MRGGFATPYGCPGLRSRIIRAIGSGNPYRVTTTAVPTLTRL